MQIHTTNQQPSDSDKADISTPESATNSSLDTSSIEVIQRNVRILDGLITNDEDTGDQVVPPTVVALTSKPQGRQETLSPTPQVAQSVRSTVKDLEPSEH